MGGLVSLPTTHTPGGGVPRNLRTFAGAQERRRQVGAFEVDQARARIARMRRAVGFSARAIQAQQRPGFRPSYVVMLTLTYADMHAWQGTHLTRFLTTVREWLRRRNVAFRYVWVAEVQARGAIHYHILCWLPTGMKLPKPDAAGWWTHGSTRVEAARDAIGYVMKYVSKAGQGKLPGGARMHGCGGLEHAMRRAKRWLGLPAFVKARSDVWDDWRPARGGGWSTPDGYVIPSEHQRVYVGDRWCVMRVADYGRPFEAEGPFSWVHREARA